ncbi:MAG: TIGR01777 family oxidoreductase [Pseudomonadota bacterium]|nr:TIGR01777 family oxidoreductase [Pseudomonadota bacterium]
MNKTLLLVGGTGFIGRELGKYLHAAGYSLRLLVRSEISEESLRFPARLYRWHAAMPVPAAAMTGLTAAINLAGAPIAARRWTAKQKQLIIASRVLTTRALVAASPPLLIQASASGFYGDTGAAAADEKQAAGSGFLADTAKAWEAEAQGAKQVAIMRFGMVLGKGGGAFPQLARIYRCGLGAVIGTGKQYVSWIHVEDVCAYVLRCLQDRTMRGVYNLVAPQALTYREFHQAFARHAPFALPLPAVPAVVLRLFWGDKSELLLASQHLTPARLLASGFKYRYPDLNSALKNLL